MTLPNPTLRLALVGQSLLEFPLDAASRSSFHALRAFLAADVTFTNLEVTLRGPRGGWPMKDLAWCTRPDASVLGILDAMGFNLLSLANNHSWDLGPTGVLDTIDAVEALGFHHAGTGDCLEAAEAPTYVETPNGKVALIAMASGNLAAEAFATARASCGDLARPGVNPLRVQDVYELPAPVFEPLARSLAPLGCTPEADGSIRIGAEAFALGETPRLVRRIDPTDAERHLALIREARAEADVVLVYVHQHHWENEWQAVGPWLRAFAHRCIDAGADAFLGHGVPMLQPVEVYHGKMIAYSLGNFVFHPTAGPATWPDERCWRSVIVQAEINGGRWNGIRFVPILLGSEDAIDNARIDDTSRRFPKLATGRHARTVLDDLQQISAPFGTELLVADDSATLTL